MKYILRGKVVDESAIAIEAAVKKNPFAKKSAKTKKVGDPKDADLCMGWVVVGFAVGHIEEARRTHGFDLKNRGIPFDQDAWMRKAVPKRICRPFELVEAADAAAVIAVRDGWLSVRVEPLYRRDLTPKMPGQAVIE